MIELPRLLEQICKGMPHRDSLPVQIELYWDQHIHARGWGARIGYVGRPALAYVCRRKTVDQALSDLAEQMSRDADFMQRWNNDESV